MSKKHERENTFKRRAGGFTLIEVMIVVVILGVLAALVVPNVMDRPDQARITKARQDIMAIALGGGAAGYAAALGFCLHVLSARLGYAVALSGLTVHRCIYRCSRCGAMVIAMPDPCIRPCPCYWFFLVTTLRSCDRFSLLSVRWSACTYDVRCRTLISYRGGNYTAHRW